MIWAPRFANALEPGVQRPIVVLNTVILSAHKAVRVVIGDLIDRSTTANGFLSSFAAQKHLDMHHVMLDYCLWVVHLGTVENDIAGLHVLFLDFQGQRIKLIALITWPQLETKVFPQVVDHAPYKATAVKKEWGRIKRIAWFAIAFGIWNT